MIVRTRGGDEVCANVRLEQDALRLLLRTRPLTNRDWTAGVNGIAATGGVNLTGSWGSCPAL
jgi:hypothetical protein